MLEDDSWILNAVTAAADYGNRETTGLDSTSFSSLSISLSNHSASSLVFFLVSLRLRFCLDFLIDCTSLSCARFELFLELYFMLFIFLIYFSIHAVSFVTKKKKILV